MMSVIILVHYSSTDDLMINDKHLRYFKLQKIVRRWCDEQIIILIYLLVLPLMRRNAKSSTKLQFIYQFTLQTKGNRRVDILLPYEFHHHGAYQWHCIRIYQKESVKIRLNPLSNSIQNSLFFLRSEFFFLSRFFGELSWLAPTLTHPSMH